MVNQYKFAVSGPNTYLYVDIYIIVKMYLTIMDLL